MTKEMVLRDNARDYEKKYLRDFHLSLLGDFQIYAFVLLNRSNK